MIAEEAFGLLKISIGSSSDEIRRAWRIQSTVHHPDTGGSNESMIRLNQALEVALGWCANSQVSDTLLGGMEAYPVMAHRVRRDVSSFTVNVLPVECWLALEVVASLCGPTIHEDPPYFLEFLLQDSSLPFSRDSWCRCECVPEAGATTIHLSIGNIGGSDVPDIDEVRDFLIEQFNHIDWPN